MEAQPNSLSKQITYFTYAFGVALLTALGSFGWWAASKIDDRSMAHQTRLVQAELKELADRLPVEQDSFALWAETLGAASDFGGSSANAKLAKWMSIHFDHDQVYLLGPENQVIEAVERGEEVSGDIYRSDLQHLAPLIEQLRRDLAVISQGSKTPTAEKADTGILDYALLSSGTPAIVSIRPIILQGSPNRPALSAEHLIISLRLLEKHVQQAVRQSTELWDLEFGTARTTDEDRLSIPLFAKSGRIVGFFSWVPEEPAFDLIAETTPVLAIGIAVATLAMTVLLSRLKRTSSMLETTKSQASFLAFHDALTGIPNRALFEDRLEQALANMRRSGCMMALHYIDLDRFKHVNDTLGHPAGDEVIRSAARRISALLDEVDTVARLGGDEFAVIQFQPTGIAAAEALSQQIVDALALAVPVAGVEALVGASVGVIVTADSLVDATDLMRQADIALYQAKDSGRGRYQLFAAELDDAVKARRQLEIDLRQALASGTGLHLVYQPIFNAAGGDLAGTEALVRWDHPVHGRMAPDAFIGLAEERGLIDQLGMWVLKSACLFCAETDLPWVAVNVSPMQFRSTHFAQSVKAILEETHLSPRRLQIEITEGLLLQNSPAIQSILQELRSAGVQVALDDFGTGYSSISYLRTHGIDKLKIDQSFTAQLGSDPQIESIIRSIVDLGQAMNMVVTAEGVETAEQRVQLTSIGCDELQGYHFSKPLAPQQLMGFLQQLAAA